MVARKPKTDEDYIKLDEAIGTLTDWYSEICDALASRNVSESTFSDVLQAIRLVHSPEEDEPEAGHDCAKEAATCGKCHRSWCSRCDPGPSALCPWCNGRGYSTAPLCRHRDGTFSSKPVRKDYVR